MVSVLIVLFIFTSGDYSVEATPVPIPNTEVKLHCADDTWWEAAREIRTSPVQKEDSGSFESESFLPQ